MTTSDDSNAPAQEPSGAAPEATPVQQPTEQAPAKNTASSLFGDDEVPMEHRQQEAPQSTEAPTTQKPTTEVTPAAQTTEAPQEQQTAPASAPVQQQQALTPEQIELARQYIAQQQQTQAPTQQQPQPQAQPPRQLTQEEVNKQLNVYTMSEADFDAIFATEDKSEAIKAFNQVLQNVARQAVTMGRVLTQQELGQFQQQVSPYIQFAETQREAMLTQEFYTTHKDLVGMNQLVDIVKTQLAQERFDAKGDVKTLFSEIAKRTKALMASFSQGPAPVQPGTVAAPVAPVPVAQPAAVKPPMAKLATGGQSGEQRSAIQGAAAGENKTAVTLFG